MRQDLVYLLLIFGLLVIPRALQRFNVPAPITSMLLGVGAMLAFGDRVDDPVVALLSTIGISSLFLFAGLEVDPSTLRRGLWKLVLHLSLRVAGLVLVGWLGMRVFDLGWQAGALLSLALLTPSTGFILDTLERLGLSEDERFWVTSKAIVGELMALAVMFVVLQAHDPMQLGVSSLWMLGMVIGLPLVFIALGRWVVPHAPGSEFSLLVMVGLIAAYVSYRLGVYYLVGAFIAGFIARMLRIRMPRLASDTNIHALRLFATFFVPFYFFHAGSGVARDALTWEAAALGLGLTAIVLPLRVGTGWLQRRMVFGEPRKTSLHVSVALAPTLVFTLVLADILYDRFEISATLFGALILYTTLNTLLPSLLLRTPLSPGLPDGAPAGRSASPVHPDDRAGTDTA